TNSSARTRCRLRPHRRSRSSRYAECLSLEFRLQAVFAVEQRPPEGGTPTKNSPSFQHSTSGSQAPLDADGPPPYERAVRFPPPEALMRYALVLTAAALFAPAPGFGAESALPPITFQTHSVDRVLNDLRAAADLVGGEKAVKSLNDGLKQS